MLDSVFLNILPKFAAVIKTASYFHFFFGLIFCQIVFSECSVCIKSTKLRCLFSSFIYHFLHYYSMYMGLNIHTTLYSVISCVLSCLFLQEKKKQKKKTKKKFQTDFCYKIENINITFTNLDHEDSQAISRYFSTPVISLQQVYLHIAFSILTQLNSCGCKYQKFIK